MSYLPITCFKAYDIRGKLGEELNEDIAYRIGRAFAEFCHPKRVVVGSDVRETSPILKQAITKGLIDSGVEVIDIGLTGSEEVYFAAFHLDVDGGLEVTASHNPMDYNGIKIVLGGAKPISSDSGLKEIQAIAEQGQFKPITTLGSYHQTSILEAYIDHLLSYIDLAALKSLTLVVNAGNGAAGHVIDALEQRFHLANVPITFIKVHHEPDGSFPHGIPNPLLPERRQATIDAIHTHQADMGIAWDADFDRCFLFDEKGQFIEGYYIVGLLAQAFLAKHPGEKIIHETRLNWNTIDIVKKSGGFPVPSKAGHAFIKETMRAENAIYGGEMSAHHFFRDFAYCDSGMIPWLLVCALLSSSGQTLSELTAQRIAMYPTSGEINRKVANAQHALASIKTLYAPQALSMDELDGIALDMGEWRFSLRISNTEPLIRLNVESRANPQLLEIKTNELLKEIERY
jgi:phosphomannomutase